MCAQCSKRSCLARRPTLPCDLLTLVPQDGHVVHPHLPIETSTSLLFMQPASAPIQDALGFAPRITSPQAEGGDGHSWKMGSSRDHCRKSVRKKGTWWAAWMRPCVQRRSWAARIACASVPVEALAPAPHTASDIASPADAAQRLAKYFHKHVAPLQHC